MSRLSCRIGPPAGNDPAWGAWTPLDDMIREAMLTWRDDARAELIWTLRERVHQVFVARVRASILRGASEADAPASPTGGAG